MALTLNTPGVFVEEISTLPPSVAQVATAIPAFIGFTHKAEKPDGSTLELVPKRITSMLEYETYFGGAENELNIDVTVTDGNIKVDTGVTSPFNMYYSLQMYFANGGGPCYIVSAGECTSLDKSKLKDGLDALEKEDEPTLIVFPEAVNLNVTLCYELYKEALDQCFKLQDRFAIIDTKMLNLALIDVEDDMDALRNGINSDANYRRYGAAYYPYLNTTLSYKYLDADVTVDQTTTTQYGAQVSNISASLMAYQTAITQYLTTGLTNIEAQLAAAADMTEGLALRPAIHAQVQQIISATESVISGAGNAVQISRNAMASQPGNAGYSVLFPLTNDVDAAITAKLEAVILSLNENLNAIDALESTDPLTDLQELFYVDDTTSVYASVGINPAGSDTLADNIGILRTGTAPTDASLAKLSTALNPYSSGAQSTAQLSAIASSDNALFNRIKAAIAQVPVLLPPSASMAGVYARVDANEGVWKAPANVGLNYVLGPNYMISNAQQGDFMNIDDQAGKSVNAIRTFTGRGTLVWGARTLDGNSNEWRYVPVRRFFNFVEESVQQAAESFVFEGNDANTWVKVRAMIENFLILQWKAGALAGAKPEQAFYVRVGLGQTMTADDVLNGRMIVEIGMAVVRPAEFIVLRFSHMMQQA